MILYFLAHFKIIADGSLLCYIESRERHGAQACLRNDEQKKRDISSFLMAFITVPIRW